MTSRYEYSKQTDGIAMRTDEAVGLWLTCYQAEVYGQAHYEHFLARTEDKELRAKLEALAAVERCTKELMAISMERLGIRTDSDPSVLAAASEDVRSFEETLKATCFGSIKFLNYYMRLRVLANERDALTVDALIAHELAVEVFARRELAGDSRNSLQPIKALSHVKFQ